MLRVDTLWTLASKTGAVLCGLLLSSMLYAEDDIVTIESTISGSQEQPKILVIVPWQKPEDADKIQDDSAKVEENPFLQPLERKHFLQKNEMLETLISDADE